MSSTDRTLPDQDPVPDPPGEEPSAARMLADLDHAGRVHRAILAEAEALPRDPAEDRLAAVLARADSPGQGKRRAPRFLVPAAAAAALFLLAWWIRGARDAEPARGDDEELLGAALELVEPLGEVPSFDAFRWKAAERASWYVVVVLDAATGAELDRSPELEDTRWQVPRERRERWPRAIRWEVRPFDAAGRAGPPAAGAASLSR